MRLEGIRVERDRLFEFRDRLLMSFPGRQSDPSRCVGFGELVIQGERLRCDRQNVVNPNILLIVQE